jgi:hypothetical protein
VADVQGVEHRVDDVARIGQSEVDDLVGPEPAATARGDDVAREAVAGEQGPSSTASSSPSPIRRRSGVENDLPHVLELVEDPVEAPARDVLLAPLELHPEEPQRRDREVDRPLHRFRHAGAEGESGRVESIVTEDRTHERLDAPRRDEARARDHRIDDAERGVGSHVVFEEAPRGPPRHRVEPIRVGQREDDVDDRVAFGLALAVHVEGLAAEDLLGAALGEVRREVVVVLVEEGDPVVVAPSREGTGDLDDVGLGVVLVAGTVEDTEREELHQLAGEVLVRDFLPIANRVEELHHRGVLRDCLDEILHAALGREPEELILGSHELDRGVEVRREELRDPGREVVVPEQHELLLGRILGLDHVVDPLVVLRLLIAALRLEGGRRVAEQPIRRVPAREADDAAPVELRSCRSEARAPQQVARIGLAQDRVLVAHVSPPAIPRRIAGARSSSRSRACSLVTGGSSEDPARIHRVAARVARAGVGAGRGREDGCHAQTARTSEIVVEHSV